MPDIVFSESGKTNAWEENKKRRCKFKKCKTTLSAYNHNNYCFKHLLKGERLEEEETKARYIKVRRRWYAKRKDK